MVERRWMAVRSGALMSANGMAAHCIANDDQLDTLNRLSAHGSGAIMDYSNDLAVIQQSAAATADYQARRQACLNFVEPQHGEKILEVGCGSGLFVHSLASAVGSKGLVQGVDLSEQQIAKARENCAALEQVQLVTGDVLDLPFDRDSFDAVVSIQTLEYVPRIDAAIQGLLRVVRPGGRFINFATNWGSVFWHSYQVDRMEGVLRAWDEHAPYPNLPAQLPRRLRATGLVRDIEQEPFTILNNSYSEAAFSYWAARLIAAFVAGKGLITNDEVEAWIQDLEAVENVGEYHFCTTGIMTRAVAK